MRFFSKIECQKGIDLILEIAQKTSDVDYYFYGPISEEDEEFFMKAVNKNKNIFYKGIFKGNNVETYEELQKYDVLLFPTRWETEGVPGIIVEAKMAGIATIVSDKSYNAELVKDGVEGLVLKDNTSEELFKAVEKLNRDRMLLIQLKTGSYFSSEKFCIESYTENILKP